MLARYPYDSPESSCILQAGEAVLTYNAELQLPDQQACQAFNHDYFWLCQHVSAQQS